jgi:type VI secretion system IcmF/VasK family protein
MRVLAILSAIAIALLGAVWASSSIGIALSGTTKVIATALVLVGWGGAGTWLFLRQRQRAARSQASLSKTMMRSASGLAEMNDQFQKSLGALRSTRPAALSVLPWYLVIGAPGAGKTTLLQESGLTFASFGAGSTRAGGPTRSCDWWFTEEAMFLDSTGRYTADTMSQAEWHAFIDLVRQVRPELALNGVVVTVSVPDLIKKDDAGVNAAAQQIRDRLNELARALDLDIPLYLVFSKCDLIGGFKDSFASLPRQQREQVLGHTLPWQPGVIGDIRTLFQRESANLLPGLRNHRLSALNAELAPDQQFKVIQFPQQFTAVQKWMGDFLAALMRPSPQQALPALRGFYFTSAQQSTKPAAAPAAAAPAQPAAPAKASGFEASIFIQANAPQMAAPTGEQNQGLFIKDLLSKVVLGDQRLVQVSGPVRRQRAVWRVASLAGSAAALLIFGIMLLSWYLGGAALIDRTIAASRGVMGVVRTEPTKVAANLAALDALRAVLERLDHHSAGGVQRVRAQAYQLYHTQLKRWFLVPVGDRLRGELEKLRTAPGKTLQTYDQLNDLYRTYLMLANEVQPNRELLERVLRDDQRWLTGIKEADRALDPAIEAGALAQLAHFSVHLADTQSTDWKITIDRPLKERIDFELREALWIPQSYEDIVSTLQSSVAKVDRDLVLPGTNRALVVGDYDFPMLFSQRGWDETMAGAIADKSESIFLQFQSINITKPKEEIRDRLRARYATDLSRHWLRFMTGVRPARTQDLREATASLRTLTGPQSPYRDLVKGVFQGLAVRYSASDLVTMPGDGDFKWLEDALTALGTFGEAADKFATATDSGRRSTDGARLVALQTAYENAWAQVGSALKAVESAERRAALMQTFENATFEVHRALSSEVTAEQDLAWRERVARPFADLLAGRFPFDRAAKNEATLASFSRLFNPKSGLVTTATAEVEKLRAIKVAGRDLLPVNRDYERLVERARDVRAALYVNDSPAISGPFTITLGQGAGVKDIRLTVGGESFGLYDRPDRRGSFTWTESSAGGAKLSITIVSDQQMSLDYSSSPWGLLRLLRDGNPTARPEGGLQFSWQFSGKAVGKDVVFNANAVLEAEALEKLVPPDFFGALVCPDHVGR